MHSPIDTEKPVQSMGTTSTRSLHQAARRWRRLLEWGYFAPVLLAFSTLGANAPLSFDLCLLLAGTLCILAFATFGQPEKSRPVSAACVGLLLALSLWIALQVLPMPASASAELWRELPRFGIEGARNSISVAPGETLEGWLRLTLPFMIFLTGLAIFRTDDQAQRAFGFLALVCIVLAVLCLGQFLFAPGMLVFAARPDDASGYAFVFVNRNTAATCLGLLVLMQCARVWQAWPRRGAAAILSWVMDDAPISSLTRLRPLAWQSGLLLLILVCLALTKSRAGITATAVAVTILVILLSWRSPASSRRARGVSQRFGRTALYGLAVLATAGVLAPRAILRGEIEGVGDGRFCILNGLFSAAHDHGLTGGGFGAFFYTFSPYRDPACGVRAVWDKAHNVVLEGLIGLGVFFIPLLLLGLWVLLRAYKTGLDERRSLAIYPMVGIAGLSLVALHSLLDFSLQVPGMAIFYAMFAALTVTLSLGRRRARPYGRDASARLKSRRPSGVTSIMIAMALLSIGLVAWNAREMVATGEARGFARALDADAPVDAGALATLVAHGLPTNRLTTCNGHVLRASLTILLAHLDRADRNADYDEWALRHAAAEDQVEHALSCLPADGNLWLRLAMLRQASGEQPREQVGLMVLSQRLFPSERRQIVGRLAHWNRLSPVTLALSRNEARTDLRLALTYLTVADIRSALDPPSSVMLELMRETVALVSPERRMLFNASGIDGLTSPERNRQE